MAEHAAKALPAGQPAGDAGHEGPPELPGSNRSWTAIAVWLLALVVCLVTVLRATYTADLSAFLPSHPTPEQAVLIDQLKEGPASRLILIGLESDTHSADTPRELARLSKALAKQLRQLPTLPGDKAAPFVSVNNGEPVAADKDQAVLLNHRYLLSPDVRPERFTVAGLHAALQESLSLLSSSAGLMLQPLLTRDPTAELVHLVEGMDTGGERQTVDGVWASADQQRSLLVAQIQADGSDLDGQERAIAAIRRQFELARQQEALPHARLLVSGPAVFATQSRHTIQSEATRLPMIGSGIIFVLLLSIYRSPRALVLGLLPMASGALAGIAAVAWGFGTVHGITLGFGITLIGEAVDYAIYLFVQRGVAGFWPTIRLGVLTSVIGFAAMLASGFPGLAQLGLFSMAGLVAAAAVTRWVLPGLIPAGFAIRPTPVLDGLLLRAVDKAPALRWALALLLAAAVATLVAHRERLWSHELTSLSPVSAEAMALDMRLRADMSAPDVRYLVVVRAPDAQAALQGAEQASAALQPLVDEGVILGVDSAAHYLPSATTQRQRQAALPDDATLRARFAQAVQGLPFKPEKFEAFFADVAASRQQPLLTREGLNGASMALGVDSLLMRQSGQWTALMGLRLPQAAAQAAASPMPNPAPGEAAVAPALTLTSVPALDAASVRALLRAAVPGAQVHFIDLKAESETLYSDYLGEAIRLSLLGALAIVLLLAVVLRAPGRLLRVVAPLLATVTLVAAGLIATGPPLTLFHLVGLLLTVAIGSNYALFFDQRTQQGAGSASIVSSMVFANLTTVAGFGMLAWSQVPVLHAMGSTVGPGAMLALLLSAVMHRPLPAALASDPAERGAHAHGAGQ
jgi:predicted exporter